MEPEVHMSKRIPLRLALAATSLALVMAAGPVLAQPADNPGRGQGQGAGQERREQAQPGRGGERGPQASREEQRRDGGWRDREQDQDGYRDRERRDGDWRGRERDRDGYRDRDRRDGDWRDRERREEHYRSGPRIDERELRRRFGERRDWVREDERAGLPPGIRMNLERGKPLPPGIAKRFDERSLGYLPRYDGYEWRRVGPDAILVDAANEIIYQVIRDVLY